MSGTINPCCFASEPLERASALRADPDWVDRQLKADNAVFVVLFHGDPLIADDRVIPLTRAEIVPFLADRTPVFLGIKNDRPYFAVDLSDDAPPAVPIGQFEPMRQAAAMLTGDELAIIGQGRWLLNWHGQHRFCQCCGCKTNVLDGGLKRYCHGCEQEYFPRTDPVSITLVHHGRQLLLGRSAHFPPDFFSTLAGFVEANETPEECAIREVREESGVVIGGVQYQFSQPWPFTSTLMMGFFAEALDPTITIDRNELEDARWFDLDELRAAQSDAPDIGFVLPPSFTIARQLIDRWLGLQDE